MAKLMPHFDHIAEVMTDAICLDDYCTEEQSVSFCIDLEDDVSFCGTLLYGCDKWIESGDGYYTPCEVAPIGVWAWLVDFELFCASKSAIPEDGDELYDALQAALQDYVKQNY